MEQSQLSLELGSKPLSMMIIEILYPTNPNQSVLEKYLFNKISITKSFPINPSGQLLFQKSSADKPNHHSALFDN
jgi:hypothetical protein